MARIEIDGSFQEQLEAAWATFAEERLGPDIADDARRYCPKRTGALAASIEHHLEGEDLIISATGGGEDDDGNMYVSVRPGREGRVKTREVHHVEEGGRTYAVYIELGHRVYHPSTGVTGPEVVPSEPFLRPALFQERGE
jgi:hypothetical protein